MPYAPFADILSLNASAEKGRSVPLAANQTHTAIVTVVLPLIALVMADCTIRIITLVPATMHNLLKLFIPLFLLAFLPEVSLGQTHPAGTIRDTPPKQPGRVKAPRFHHKTKQVEPLRRVQIDEETSLLFDTEGTFLYLGSIRQLNNGNCFPSGKGICRTSGEYILCPWKRGSKHGDGIIKTEDGVYRKAVWKWNRPKATSGDAPLPEEIAEMEDYISRMEGALKLL